MARDAALRKLKQWQESAKGKCCFSRSQNNREGESEAKSRTTVSTLQSVENSAPPQSQDGSSSGEESQTWKDCEDEDTINTSEEKSISEGAILQAAKAMRLSKAEADAQVEVICQGSSDLKKRQLLLRMGHLACS